MMAIALGIYSCTPVEDNLTSVSEEASKSLGTVVYKGKEYPNAFDRESIGDFTDPFLQEVYETNPEATMFLYKDNKMYLFDTEAELRTSNKFKGVFERLDNAASKDEFFGVDRGEVIFNFIRRGSGNIHVEQPTSPILSKNLPS